MRNATNSIQSPYGSDSNTPAISRISITTKMPSATRMRLRSFFCFLFIDALPFQRGGGGGGGGGGRSRSMGRRGGLQDKGSESQRGGGRTAAVELVDSRLSPGDLILCGLQAPRQKERKKEKDGGRRSPGVSTWAISGWRFGSGVDRGPCHLAYGDHWACMRPKA